MRSSTSIHAGRSPRLFRLAATATLALLAASLNTVVSGPVGPASAATTRLAESAGARAIGSTAYAIPAGAVFVARSGNDSASGKADAPLRTLARALVLVPGGGTIVLREGEYNEQVTVDKKVTLQSYPNERVWLDGSVDVNGWVRDGSRWRHDGWTTRFDHSPTYVKGAPDYTAKDWRFINPDFPMAAHPDQVWIGGKRQTQVTTLGEVQVGSFYLNERTSQLYVGSDPTDKAVDASNLPQAMSIRAAGVVVRGIGIRRYAPSVWHVGAITVERPGATFENVHISDMATTGISVLAPDVTLRKLTVDYSGMLGIHARFADNLSLQRVLSRRNNAESFNIAPVSGGAKIAQTRGVSVGDSNFSDNYGPGFWQDMSVSDSVFRGSDFNRNAGDGLFLEISARAVVGDSTFLGNAWAGIKVNNTSDVKIWNNTFIGNGRSLWLAQDQRRNTNRSDPAVDPRRPWPDPGMPWQLQDVTLSNNVIGRPDGSANCLLCVEDYSRQDSAEAMRIRANGNVYVRSDAGSPRWLAIWSRGNADPAVYTSLKAFRDRTGQEARGVEQATTVVSSDGALATSVQDRSDQVGIRLPADVASSVGRPSGGTFLGAWDLGGAAAASSGGGGPSGGSATDCASYQIKLTQLVHPVSQANLITRWSDEASIAATRYGFSQSLGVLGQASGADRPGLAPIWRLYRNGDFVWAAEGSDVAELTGRGYTAQFVDFYAATSPTPCLEPIYRLTKGAVHRLASEAKTAELVRAGWTREKVAFYLRAP